MLATGYGEQAALRAIKAASLDSEKGRVTVACVNSPASTTLSGDEPAIDYMDGILKDGGVFSRKLKVETAYHSHHMEKVSASYLQSLGELASNETQGNIEFYSSVTGAAKTSGFGPAYWVENLVSQVCWAFLNLPSVTNSVSGSLQRRHDGSGPEHGSDGTP